MDSIAYRQLVRQKAAEIFWRAPAGWTAAVQGLAEQYVSITEADGLPRFTVSVEVLEHALAACTDKAPSGRCFNTLVDRSSLGPNYRAVYPIMREVLEATFNELR
jgi:hypothetical protein